MKLSKLLLPLVIGITSAWAQHHPHTEHGFVLIGDRQLHAYHLARFNSPHQYQVIFELRLLDPAGRPIDVESVKRETGARLLSLLSEDHFLVADLVGPVPMKSFKARLFSGYLRDREHRRLLLEGLQVEVVRVDYFQELDPAGPVVEHKQLIVSCDEKTQAFYAAHLVNGPVAQAGQRGNFEELIRINTDSSCRPELQGKVLTALHSPVVPFKVGEVASGGQLSFTVEEVLMLDTRALVP